MAAFTWQSKVGLPRRTAFAASHCDGRTIDVTRGRANEQPRSLRIRLCRLFGFARFGADRLFRRCRLDAERPAGCDRRDRFLGVGPEEYPAARAELRFVADHANRDPVDIGNIRAAQPERIVAASLLLFGRVGAASGGPHRNQERGGQHQAEPEFRQSSRQHESPQIACGELWVKDGGMARTTVAEGTQWPKM
jgi:hypothetical protein